LKPIDEAFNGHVLLLVISVWKVFEKYATLRRFNTARSKT
jgi:hypothetical protein